MCFLSTFAFAQKATFTGKFKEIDVEKAGAFLSNASDMSDSRIPMKIKPDGSFSFELDCEKPSRYYIILEEPHTGVQFYAEKGMKADMQVSFREVSENGMDRTVCDVVYTGDNKDCYDFIQDNSFSLVMNKVLMRHYGTTRIRMLGKKKQQRISHNGLNISCQTTSIPICARLTIYRAFLVL